AGVELVDAVDGNRGSLEGSRGLHLDGLLVHDEVMDRAPRPRPGLQGCVRVALSQLLQHMELANKTDDRVLGRCVSLAQQFSPLIQDMAERMNRVHGGGTGMLDDVLNE